MYTFRVFAAAALVSVAVVCLLVVGCSGSSDNASENATESTPAQASANNEPVRLEVPLSKTQSSVDYARLLSQASFGVTHTSLVLANRHNSLAAWIDEQIALPVTLQLPLVEAYGNASWGQPRHWVWWDTVINAEDQLRQRVAFALSEIFVVSDIDYTLGDSQHAVVHYYDMLATSAFGNFRELLEDITLHPVMGIYLSMVRNEKADLEKNIRPDENYAREIMQLFTIGLYELNQGGTPIPLGNPAPAYTQSNVEEYARVFTGWNFVDSPEWQTTHLSKFDKKSPMIPWEDFHDTGSKQLLNKIVAPAGLSARDDLKLALDSLFNHANVGPFISKQLIQRLVTSNPSEQYVTRVASVFDNNGKGTRGDLEAVVKAILLDAEARQAPVNMDAQTAQNFGKLKEPLIRVTHIMRALNATPGVNAEGHFHLFRKTNDVADEVLGQAVLSSPSVFNFFSPAFRSSYNTVGSDQTPLYAPELQILTESLLSVSNNDLHSMLYGANNRSGATSRAAMLDLDAPIAMLRKGRSVYLDHLNMLLLSGTMSESMQLLLAEFIDERVGGGPGDRSEEMRASIVDRRLAVLDESDLENMVLDSLFMILASPEFMVQR